MAFKMEGSDSMTRETQQRLEKEIRRLKVWIGLHVLHILLLLVMVVGIMWMVYQWRECRQAGLSVLYCIKHIT